MKYKIGDLTKIRTGKLDANAANENGQYPFFTCSKETLQISTYSYDCECVLVAGNGDLNVKYYNGKFDAYQRTYIIESNGKGDLYIPYLYYFMDKYVDELRRQSIGGVIKYIKLGNLTEAIIELPDINRQKEIVQILGKVKEVIDSRITELRMLEELIKARFVEMFGDPVLNSMGWLKERLEKHVDVITGFPFESEKYVDNGIKICGGLIIMPDKIEWDKCKYWESSIGFEEFLLSKDDIVISMDRPWVSNGFKIAKIEEGSLPALLIQRTARVRAKDINQCYLFNYFKFGGFDIHCNITGSLVPHISVKDIVSFSVMLPPLELQSQFADFVQQIDKSKFIGGKLIN